MIPDSARRKAPPRSAALRPASSLSNPSSSSSSRSPSPPIKVPNALLLGGGTYNGNPQASSNLQLLAAASGLLSTTPDTLETVKGELLDRQQLGGLPLLFKDLARLGRLSLSNEEGEEGKMKIDKELGEPQIENSSDEEMLKARERIRDDGESDTVTQGASASKADPSLFAGRFGSFGFRFCFSSSTISTSSNSTTTSSSSSSPNPRSSCIRRWSHELSTMR